MRERIKSGTSLDALFLTVIRLVTILLGIVVTRLLSQYLSVYDYGTYSQVMLVVSTVNTLTILGMIDGVNYFYCSEPDPERRSSYISTIFALQCIVNLISGGTVIVFAKQISMHFDNPDISGLLVYAAILPLLINLLSMLQVLLVSVGKARMLAIRNLIVSLSRLAAVFIVVTVVQNVAIILTVTLLLDVVQIVFFCTILWKKQCPIQLRRIDWRLFKTIFCYCAPMGVFTAVSALNRDCDKYLIAIMTDTETLAVYTNASKVLPFDIIMNSFSTVLVPAITHNIAIGKRKIAGKLYKSFLEISYVSTTILCCAVLSVPEQAMEFLYSEKYAMGKIVFCIYILVDLLRFTNITMVLAAAGKTKNLMCISVGALVMNALLNIVLFYCIGICGPAVATLLTTLGSGSLILWMGAREVEHSVFQLFDRKFFILFFLENLVAVLLFTGIQKGLAALGLHYFWILVLVCGAYCGVMLLLHGKRLFDLLKSVNEMTKSE